MTMMDDGRGTAEGEYVEQKHTGNPVIQYRLSLTSPAIIIFEKLGLETLKGIVVFNLGNLCSISRNYNCETSKKSINELSSTILKILHVLRWSKI